MSEAAAVVCTNMHAVGVSIRNHHHHQRRQRQQQQQITNSNNNNTPKQSVVDVEGEGREVRPEVLEQPPHVDAALLVPRRAGVHNNQPPLGLTFHTTTGPESGQPVFQHMPSETVGRCGGGGEGAPVTPQEK